MEKLNKKDFQERIDNKDFDSIRDEIFEKTMNLVNKILELKKINVIDYEDNERFIKLHNNASKEEILEKIKRLFYYKILTCSDIHFLIKWLTEDYEKENKILTDYEISVWIRNYNEYVDELEEYLKYKSEIDKKGYENIHKEYLNKIENLFKEMLDYKNKPYDKNIKLKDLFKKIELYYAYYSYTIYLLRIALIGLAPGYNIEKPDKALDNVEKYMLIKSYYNYLKNNYKEKAFIYRDFDLEEGQTTTDLHMKEMEKFNKLYKKMLDFIHVPYEENYTPHKIECLVLEHYPYYKEIIENIYSNNHFPNPTVALLTRYEDAYDIISKGYKNYEEDIKKYVPPKEEKKENIDLTDESTFEDNIDLDELFIDNSKL